LTQGGNQEEQSSESVLGFDMKGGALLRGRMIRAELASGGIGGATSEFLRFG
jgi:hypothetical protein